MPYGAGLTGGDGPERMSGMEFRDLKEQYLQHKEAIDGAVQRVLEQAHFIGGEQVQKLEEKLAAYTGVKHCITCANGTDALQLALMACGVREGDAVFVPDFTFFATAEVAPWVGATPIFVDVDRHTFNLSPQALEEAVRNVIQEGKLKPRVVIAVDLFGQAADYAALRRITQQYGMLLMEDAAQGFGGKIGEQKACSFGDISTTSFFPAKPLGCYGDGGAVFTDNDDWAELLRSYKVHGKGSDKYDNVRIGINSRLDTLQAAVLIEKLQFLDEELERCNEAAASYTEKLKGHVKTPVVLSGYYSSWAQYTVQFENKEQREKAAAGLKEAGIPSMVYYMKPMHKQAAFADMALDSADCPVTERICDTCLSLPMHPYLQEQDVHRICEALLSSLEK